MIKTTVERIVNSCNLGQPGTEFFLEGPLSRLSRKDLPVATTFLLDDIAAVCEKVQAQWSRSLNKLRVKYGTETEQGLIIDRESETFPAFQAEYDEVLQHEVEIPYRKLTKGDFMSTTTLSREDLAVLDWLIERSVPAADDETDFLPEADEAEAVN